MSFFKFLCGMFGKKPTRVTAAERLHAELSKPLRGEEIEIVRVGNAIISILMRNRDPYHLPGDERHCKLIYLPHNGQYYLVKREITQLREMVKVEAREISTQEIRLIEVSRSILNS